MFLPTLDQELYSSSNFVFELIDIKSRGSLDQEEMLLAVDDLTQRVPNLDFTTDDVTEIFKKLDLDKTDEISHSIFVIATLDKGALGNDIILRLFKDLDTLNENFITRESVQLALRRKGLDISIESL